MSDENKDNTEETGKAVELEVSPWKRAKNMGFFDHLEELRWTLVKCAIAFVAFAALIGYYLKDFNDAMLWPMAQVQSEFPKLNLNLVTNSLVDGFNIVVQMCMLGGFALASPFILFFVGQFAYPALNEKERRTVLPLCGAALVLFVAGSTFSFFYLMPSAIRVSLQINEMMGYMPLWTPGSYYKALSWLVLGVGASFEYPLVLIFLIWIGVLTTAFLRKYRRHAIVLILILAAIITPTGDPVNLALLATPLYVLYEISIVAGSRVEKRRAARARM